MIISIKKRDLLIVTAALVLIIFVPFIYSQVGLGAKAGVGVWVVISNQNPVNITINISNAQAFDPKNQICLNRPAQAIFHKKAVEVKTIITFVLIPV